MMTHIKYCGLSHEDEIELAADLGVSFVGFVVLAPMSHRNLDLDQAAELVRATPPEVETVLVTPETDREALDEALGTVDPEIAQLTGHLEDGQTRALARKHGLRTWRAYSPSGHRGTDQDRLRELSHVCEAIVLDAVDPSGYGGHGDPLEWDHARRLVEALAGFPTVLAGGLDPGNVGQAIDWVRPWCVDVSSGIEVDGRKDPGRMREFVAAIEEIGGKR